MNAPQSQHALFQAQGWLHLPNATSTPLLTHLNHGAHRILGATLAQVQEAPATPHVWQIPGVRFHEPAFADPRLDALIARVATELLRCEQVQLLQDVLLLKPPRCTGQIDWHRDYTYLGFLEPSIVTLRIALTDSSLDMGCMEVITTSHTWPAHETQRVLTETLGEDALKSLSPEHRSLVEQNRLPLPMQAGDLAAHHCQTIHGSFENPTEHARMSLLVRVFDANCRLRTEHLPNPEALAHFQTTDDGRLSEEQFPLLHQDVTT